MLVGIAGAEKVVLTAIMLGFAGLFAASYDFLTIAVTVPLICGRMCVKPRQTKGGRSLVFPNRICWNRRRRLWNVSGQRFWAYGATCFFSKLLTIPRKSVVASWGNERKCTLRWVETTFEMGRKYLIEITAAIRFMMKINYDMR